MKPLFTAIRCQNFLHLVEHRLWQHQVCFALAAISVLQHARSYFGMVIYFMLEHPFSVGAPLLPGKPLLPATPLIPPGQTPST